MPLVVLLGGLGRTVVTRSDAGCEGDGTAQRLRRVLVLLRRVLLRPVLLGLRLRGRRIVVRLGVEQREILDRLERLRAGRVLRFLAVPGHDGRLRGLFVERDALLVRLAVLAVGVVL